MKPASPTILVGRTAAFAFLLILTLTLLAAPVWVNAAPPKQEPVQVPSVDGGAALWTENCAPCHGASGQGDGPTIASMGQNIVMPDFTDPEAAKTRTLADMFTTIKEGRMDKLMPPWKNRLSDEQIWDVAAYVQSLSTSPAELQAAGPAYAENCAECHGVDGVSADIDLSAPAALVGQSPQALFDSLRAAEGNHASLADVSDDALWQSLAVVRTFSVQMPEPPQLDGVFSGQILNGSTGEPAPNVALTLYVLDSNGQTLETRDGMSDADGNFTFENLDRSHTRTYGLEAAYLGISYFSQEPVIFLPDEDHVSQSITVYETTQDGATVTQNTFHRILSFGTDAISVADVYVFSNSGNSTYVGELQSDGVPATVKIALPPEATEVSFRSNTARQLEDGAYYSGEPVPPGDESYTLFVSYLIPFSEDRLSVETPLFYDVGTVNVMASDQGQSIESDQIEFNGVQSIQGSDFQLWAGTGLKAGEPFKMTFADLDKIEMPASAGGNTASQREAANVFNQNIALWSAMLLGLLAIAFAVFFGGQQPVASPVTDLRSERDHLLIMLKELDALKQNGELDDTTYHRLQQRYRNSLKYILAQLHD